LPAETLGGSFTKEWIITENGSRVLRKLGFEEQTEAEYASCALARDLGIPCNKAEKESPTTVLIYNISDFDLMLLTYQQLGIKVNGFSPKAVASIFEDRKVEQHALIQILFDAIVGNNDRKNNMGNLAVLKNADTGEITFPPMFDFNLAHHLQKNLFLGDVARNIHADGYSEKSLEILKDWGQIPNTFWEQNRIELIQKIEK
jgi:hypothetical protein